MIKTANSSQKQVIEDMIKNERMNGYLNFKKAVMNSLVETYATTPEKAEHIAFSTEMNDIILEDISWSQHMGPTYFAEVAAYKFKL